MMNFADKEGVPFQIFYGVSGNDHNFWSIANARRVIGYVSTSRRNLLSYSTFRGFRFRGSIQTGGLCVQEPEDNSGVRFIDAVAAHVAAAKAAGVGK